MAMNNPYSYDVALSFAGEDRIYVRNVANELHAKNIRVFYDDFEQTSLWGKDLYSYLSDVYKNKALFTIIFISLHYKNKLWTNLERESAQARAFKESVEYILPARFDDTEIPGMLPTVGYIDLRDMEPVHFAGLIENKVRQFDSKLKTPKQNVSTKTTLSLPNDTYTSILKDEQLDVEGEFLLITNKFCNYINSGQNELIRGELEMFICQHIAVANFNLFKKENSQLVSNISKNGKEKKFSRNLTLLEPLSKCSEARLLYILYRFLIEAETNNALGFTSISNVFLVNADRISKYFSERNFSLFNGLERIVD